MSDKKTDQDWVQDWQALQNRYWNAWSDATQSAVGRAVDVPMPWQAGIEQWQQMFGNAGKQSEATERLLGSAKSYVALMQALTQFASGKHSDAAPLQTWMDTLRQGFDLAAGESTPAGNPIAAMLRAIGGPGTLNLEQLNAQFAPMFEQAHAQGMSWLHAPAFGFSREHQERYQKALVAFDEYQHALKRYNDLMLQASKRSFEILESKLADCAEPGRQIDSMRGLYNLWVDAAEDAYAEVALSDEFSKVYGNLVNAQMRVRANLQAEAERLSAELGMPTRAELDSVHRQLHELRRQLRGQKTTATKTVAGESAASKSAETPAASTHPVDEVAPAIHNRDLKPRRAAAKSAKPGAAKSGNFADAIDDMRSRSTKKPPKRGRSGGRASGTGRKRTATASRKRGGGR